MSAEALDHGEAIPGMWAKQQPFCSVSSLSWQPTGAPDASGITSGVSSMTKARDRVYALS